MRKTSIINVSLLAVLLTMIVVGFSVLIARNNYITDTAKVQKMLGDSSVTNYFTNEKIEATYEIDGAYQDFILKPLCADCDQPITNMHNSGSMLITSAPESICDTDVERCVLYDFDPFGIGLFSRQTILRSEKIGE